MKSIRRLFCSAALLFIFGSQLFATEEQQVTNSTQKIKVMLFTGGHGFDKPQFFKLLCDNTEISLLGIEHPNAHGLLRPQIASAYDVLLLYDMWQEISDEAKTNFVDRLKEGKGLVVLHHALCSYQTWPEYTKVIGGKYLMEKAVINGVEMPASSYKHDMKFQIRVADPNHPITRGLKDFEILDETYKGFFVAKDVHPLLTTDEPESTKTIAWTKTYEGTRVVVIQLGHGPTAFQNPNYERLVKQAIRWAAKKD